MAGSQHREVARSAAISASHSTEAKGTKFKIFCIYGRRHWPTNIVDALFKTENSRKDHAGRMQSAS